MLELPLSAQPRLVTDLGAIAASSFPTGYAGTHRNAFWVLNLLDGEGELELAGQRLAYRAGWAVVTPPDVAHTFRNRQRVPFLHAHFRAAGAPVGMPPAQDLGPRAAAARELLRDAAARVAAEPERAAVALWHLLWQLSATPLRPAAPVHHPAIRALLALLAAHDGPPPAPAALGRRLGLTPRHLNRLCTAAFGQPLCAWLRRSRLERARRLLADTDWPVARIATACGYRDLQHFNKAMRAFAGAPPRALR